MDDKPWNDWLGAIVKCFVCRKVPAVLRLENVGKICNSGQWPSHQGPLGWFKAHSFVFGIWGWFRVEMFRVLAFDGGWGWIRV